MKIKEMTKDELEMISYDDLAYMILAEYKKKFKITDLFKKVCDLKGLSDQVFENKIGDFFELLTIDQRFYMLDNGNWDLKERHTNKIKINTVEDEEEEEDSELIDEDIEDEEEEEDIFYEHDETDDEAEDDLKDLVIIDEDEEETDNL